MRLHSLLFACGAALLLTACNERPENTWQGYAEGDYVRVAPVDGGIVEALAVKRGDRVARGDLLFRLETTVEQAAVENAEAGLAEARATLKEAELEYQRKLKLREQRNVAQAEVDTAHARRDRAGAAMLAAASAITQAKWRLARREGHAPADAVVQDVMFREGEFANPNQPVVSLLPPENIKVRFFVPEAELGHIAEGGKVRFACSDCPENATGTIRFISTEAEFTPPVIYSDQSKEKLVYMAEATPDDNPETLHPGQPVTVSLPPQQTE